MTRWIMLLAILAPLGLMPAQASAEERWFQVEVLVFARTQASGGEHWRLDVRPEYPRDHVRYRTSGASLPDNASNPDRQALRQGAWQALPDDRLSLTAMRQQMERSGEYRSLFHSSWRQPMRERDQTIPVHIQGGRELSPDPALYRSSFSDIEGDVEGDGDQGSQDMSVFDSAPQYELQGTLQLSVSRFLHIDPNLWFTRVDSDDQRYYVNIDQSRRMRSDELHYIDHPLFGIIVKVTR